MASQPGVFNVQEFTDLGALSVGGRLYTYDYGTTTQKTAYTDAAGVVPHTYTLDGLGGQYIALNARGELPAPLYLASGSYDLALKTSAGATVWTRRADPTGADLAASGGASLVSFLQAGTGAVAKTVQDELRASFRLSQFLPAGVTEDNSTDLTTYVNAAVAACIAQGNYALELQGISVITDLITITSPITIWSKRGPKYAGFRQTTSNKGGLYFNLSNAQGGGIDGISVEAGAGFVTSGFQGSGSTGVGVKVKSSFGKFVANNYGIHNFDTAASVNGCYYTRWFGLEHFYCTTAALVVDTSDGTSAGVVGAGNWFISGKPSNFGFTGTNTASVFLDLKSSGGDYFYSLDATTFNNAIRIKPDAGKQVSYCQFFGVLGDDSLSDNWLVDGSAGGIYGVTCVNCWGAYSTNGAGLVTKGASLDGFTWTSGNLRENGKQGWDHQSGKNVIVNGAMVAANSKLTSNTYDGVAIGASCDGWALLNCRAGNFASSLSGQANAVSIGANATNGRVLGNDLRDYGAGKLPVVNSSTSTDIVVNNNLPLQTVGSNTSGRLPIPVGSAGVPTAGVTVYFGVSGFYTTANGNPFVCPKKGAVTGFYIECSVAPGAGKTFTYTVYKNAVATSMTGTISGAASFFVAVGSTNAFTVSATDKVTLQLVPTDAAVGAAIHTGTLFFEP